MSEFDWRTDPKRLASAIEDLSEQFKEAQGTREAQLLQLTTLTSKVDSLSDSFDEIKDVAFRGAVWLMTALAGWAASVLR